MSALTTWLVEFFAVAAGIAWYMMYRRAPEAALLSSSEPEKDARGAAEVKGELSGSSQGVGIRASTLRALPHHLSEAEVEALASMRLLVKAAGALERIDPFAQIAAETRDETMLRFLRARQLAVKPAFDLLMGDLEWRERVGVLDIGNREAKDVLGCDIKDIWQYSACWIQVGTYKPASLVFLIGWPADCGFLHRVRTAGGGQ